MLLLLVSQFGQLSNSAIKMTLTCYSSIPLPRKIHHTVYCGPTLEDKWHHPLLINVTFVFITSNKILLPFYYSVMRVETALLLYITLSLSLSLSLSLTHLLVSRLKFRISYNNTQYLNSSIAAAGTAKIKRTTVAAARLSNYGGRESNKLLYCKTTQTRTNNNLFSYTAGFK